MESGKRDKDREKEKEKERERERERRKEGMETYNVSHFILIRMYSSMMD